jgi:diguanylate cyclase (GGDEF)-like protein/PAS domain S-box-containing protein
MDYKTIFEQAHVGLAKLSLDGRFLTVNAMLCKLLGYSREELLQFTFKDITHHDDIDENLLQLNKLLNQEITTYITDKRYIHKNGNVIWARVTASVVRSTKGVPKYFLGVIQENARYQAMELEISKKEKHIRAMLAASIDGFWIVDVATSKLIEVNDVYCRLSGYSRAELLNMYVFDLDYLESATEVKSRLDRIIQHNGDVFITKHCRKNGEIWPVEVTVTYSNVDNGRAFVFLRDISERYFNRTILELRVKLSDLVHKGSINALSQTVIDCAEELTYSKIGFFHFVEENETVISPQVWSTNTIQNFCSTHEILQHYLVTKAGVWADCIRQHCPIIHNDYNSLSHKKGLPEGHPPVERELVVPIFRNNKIVAILGVGNKNTDYTEADIHIVKEIGDLAYDYLERKLDDERIEFMAYYDALTHLPNRTLLLDRINQAIAQTNRNGKLLALAYLDLDGFKPVNDRYGHAAGDLFLKAFAQRISKMLRVVDTLARLGGDEFAVILPSLSSIYDAEAVLWRLLDALTEPFCIYGHEIQVGASIGFTVYPIDQNDPETLLRHADQAMYQSKWHGKNTVRLYDTAHHERLRLQQEIIDELRHALQYNELILHYQPKVKLVTGEIVGFEANIVWQHPKRGLLQAEDFLPVLEGTYKIMRLDKWAIYQVLSQLTAWNFNGNTFNISLNISYRSICEPEFLIFIRDQAQHWNYTIIKRLEIELQKPFAEFDFNILSPIVKECNTLGINFSLDDFYFTHATVEQIKTLKLCAIKLPAQMVREASKHLESFTLLTSNIAEIHQLNLPIVAQGIDSIELAALLIDLDCQQGQGACIAQPIPANMVLEWYRTWHLDVHYRNLRQLNPHHDHTALLQLAIYNVQRWGENVIKFVATNGESEYPVLCTNQCSMHDWYHGLGLFRYGNLSGFAFQSTRHRTLHQMASKIVELLENGFYNQAQAKLADFKIQYTELINMLTRLKI